ncbi:hypothetical protein CHUAL_001369 [Chamberlinius hualienensis]
MTTVLSPYSSVGFYKAPVTKSLLEGLFITSCALHLPQLAHLKQYLQLPISDIFEKYGIFKYILCRCVFFDVKDLVCGAILVYYFRVFEKRSGSLKFGSKLVTSWIISLTMELIVLSLISKIDVFDIYGPSGLIISGPFGLIFPLFVNYFCDIPRVAQTHILGVPITGKTLTYCLGLQMISSSVSSCVSGTCGILAGLVYRYNVGNIQRFQLPKSLAKFLNATIGRLVASSPPQESNHPMGATLEIQRSQQLEMLEHQMLLNRSRDQRAYGQFYSFPRGFQDTDNGQLRRRLFDNLANHGHDSSNDNVSVNESQVQTLVEMGFDRDRVIAALRSSDNDLQLATTLLLRDT